MELARRKRSSKAPGTPIPRPLIDAVPKFGHSKDARRYGTLLAKDQEAREDKGCIFYPRCAVADDDVCGRKEPV